MSGHAAGDAELRLAEERFRTAFEEAPIGMALVARDRSWLRVNRSFCQIVGYSEEELLAGTIDQITHPDDVGASRELVGQILAGEIDSYQIEKRYLHKLGHVVWIRLSVSLVRDPAGAPLHFISQIEDITAAKEADRALRESQARLQAMFENIPAGLSLRGLDGRYVHVNRLVAEGRGASPEQMLGVNPSALYDAETNARIQAADREMLRSREPQVDEYGVPQPDGGIRELHVVRYPVLDQAGEITAFGAFALDITERKRIESALAESEERQRLVLASLPDAIVAVCDQEGRILLLSGPVLADAGVDPDSLIGRSIADTLPAQLVEQLDPIIVHALAGESGAGQFSWSLAGATYEVQAEPYRRADGTVAGALLVGRDITERLRRERELEAAEARFRAAFEDAPIGIALISQALVIERANAAFATICASTRSQLAGRPLRELVHPADAGQLAGELAALVSRASEEQLSLEVRLLPVAGSGVDVAVHGTLLHDRTGGELRLLCQFVDVSERNRYEQKLQFMADHDPLTGLANRRKFEAELDRHVAHVARYGAEGALIVLDIDDFKQVNDTLGHNAGDELIVSVAGLLRARLRESDVLARLGGDEFAILLPRADGREAARVADALIAAVRDKGQLVGGERRRVTISVGVSMFDAGPAERSSEVALIEADLAMYDAKEAGRDRHAFYPSSERRASRTQARLTWVGRIEDALEHERFVLVAQPIVELATGRIDRHELLIRMLDGQGDLIPPASFLHIAERVGLISRIDEWVARQAIDLIGAHPGLGLSVNISGRSLGDRRLLRAVEAHLRASRADPSQLLFEVTETAAVANITDAQLFAGHLHDAGCRFALDDFGAGFGSFYYLKHLPFDYVKIDGEFIRHAVTGHIDQLVIHAVVAIAQGLGKETIAEFVTNARTRRIVQRLGVDYAQGNHIGVPIALDQLVRDHALVDPGE